MNCKICGSFAINPHLHGRDDSDLDLCDVCYWRKRADKKPKWDNFKELNKLVKGMSGFFREDIHEFIFDEARK